MVRGARSQDFTSQFLFLDLDFRSLFIQYCPLISLATPLSCLLLYLPDLLFELPVLSIPHNSFCHYAPLHNLILYFRMDIDKLLLLLNLHRQLNLLRPSLISSIFLDIVQMFNTPAVPTILISYCLSHPYACPRQLCTLRGPRPNAFALPPSRSPHRMLYPSADHVGSHSRVPFHSFLITRTQP